MWNYYPSKSLRTFKSMRAVRFSTFFMRSRVVIKVVLKAASALENTDGEQIELRKFFAPLLQKYFGNFCRKSKGKVYFSCDT